MSSFFLQLRKQVKEAPKLAQAGFGVYKYKKNTDLISSYTKIETKTANL